MWEVSFKPRAYLSPRKEPHYILNMRLGGAQNSYECFGELKSILLLSAIKTPFPGRAVLR